jgi:hypothetical protein
VHVRYDIERVTIILISYHTTSLKALVITISVNHLSVVPLGFDYIVRVSFVWLWLGVGLGLCLGIGLALGLGLGLWLLSS